MTSADLLAALHQATGMPMVSDAYTRLYPVAEGTVRDRPLYEVLNAACDAIGLRWHKEGAWLQFRSAAYFNDRLKEVPRAKLARWSSLRREHGTLALEEVLEIARLSDAQLDAREMAEGARRCWGIAEWEVARAKQLRPHLRFAASLTSEQRREGLQPGGLPFRSLTLPQQQEFLHLGLEKSGESLDVTPDELAKATLRLLFRRPGWFRWTGSEQGEAPMPARTARLLTVGERTREAALAAARRIDPAVPDAEIVPVGEPEMTLLYTVGGDDSPLAQRRVGTRGQSFATR